MSKRVKLRARERHVLYELCHLPGGSNISIVGLTQRLNESLTKHAREFLTPADVGRVVRELVDRGLIEYTPHSEERDVRATDLGNAQFPRKGAPHGR